MSILIETNGIPRLDRLEYWIDASSDLFAPIEVMPTPGLPFWGRLSCHNLAPMQISHIEAGPHVVRCTPRLVSRSATDHYKLLIVESGSVVLLQDGTDARLHEGDLAIFDCSRPYAIASERPYRMLVYKFPRSVVSPVKRLTAARIPGNQGIGWLAAPFLSRLVWLLRNGDGEDTGERLVDNVLDLMGTLCTSQIELESTLATDVGRSALRERIHSYISEHLGDAALTPSRIASAHFISTRYLYKLFEIDGVSVSRWIRDRRLDQCRRDLRDASLATETVSTISTRWGFRDSAHFSRAFRTAYGCSPREYRAAASQAPTSRSGVAGG